MTERSWNMPYPCAEHDPPPLDADGTPPVGVPVATTVMAVTCPEHDTEAVYYWRTAPLDDAAGIIQMQRDGWSVAGLIAPHFLRVWLRLPRGNLP